MAAVDERAELIESSIMDLRRFALVLTRDAEAADDLVQDTIERVLARWHLRRPDRPIRPWLFAILRNLYLSDGRRRRRRRAVLIDDPDGEAAAHAAHPGSEPELSLEAREALSLLAALPEEQRTALELVAVEGFSYRETAEIMGVPVGTVMSRLSRAREKLRALVQDRSGERAGGVTLRSIK